MNTGFIYALVDPRDGAVKYVGQTIYKLQKRLTEHCVSPRTRQQREWIEDLAALGLRPSIRLLEEVPTADLNRYENYWMAEMAYQGAYLLNRRFDYITLAAYHGQRPERP